MERLKKNKKTKGLTPLDGKHLTGLTLLELLIALMLLTTVLMTTSAMLSSFHKFYYDFGQNQGSITETSLGILEEIVGKITIANRAAISEGGARVDIRIDEANTPSNFSDDATHTYRKVGTEIKYSKNGSAEKTIAKNIELLTFENQPVGSPAYNRVKINIGIKPTGGSVQQNFETTVVARCRDAQISS